MSLRTVSVAVIAAASLAVGAWTSPAGAGAPAASAARLTASSGEARPSPHYNVLFIAVDDLRADFGVYGDRDVKSPNMDALAQSAMLFTHHYVQQAVCGPSRASLMTGLRPDSTGIQDLHHTVSDTDPNAVTMTDLFKQNGYFTAGFGKIYHFTDDDMRGWSLRVPDDEFPYRRAERRAGKPNVADAAAPNASDLPDTVNVNAALAEMAKLADSKQPFFLAVGIHKPHLPFVSPQVDWDRYKGKPITPTINPEGQKGAPPWALVSYEIWNYVDTPDHAPMPVAKRDQLHLAYMAATSYADSLVGELTAKLHALGLDKNTIVVLWGDNGWKIGDHDAWAKHSNCELDIHEPLIMRVPGITHPGERTNAMVETVDIYPTLAALAGLKPPADLEGLSMVPVLRDPDIEWKQAAFAQFGRGGHITQGNGRLMGRTVRTQRYRYTAWVQIKTGKVVAEELYDEQEDPGETTNVAGEPRYAAALKMVEGIYREGWQGVRSAVEQRQ